jgi:hypothetical protein
LAVATIKTLGSLSCHRKCHTEAGRRDEARLGAAQGFPIVEQLVSPDRWLLWLGVLFALSVYWFPAGVVGRLRALRGR